MRATHCANVIKGKSSDLLAESQRACKGMGIKKFIRLLSLSGLTGMEAKQQAHPLGREDKTVSKAAKGSFGISEKGTKGQCNGLVHLTGGQSQES